MSQNAKPDDATTWRLAQETACNLRALAWDASERSREGGREWSMLGFQLLDLADRIQVAYEHVGDEKVNR